jgi:hypothetical protein
MLVQRAVSAGARAPAALTAASAASRRWLNLHENQSMSIMREFGVPVPPGLVATTAAEADAAFAQFASKAPGA